MYWRFRFVWIVVAFVTAGNSQSNGCPMGNLVACDPLNDHDSALLGSYFQPSGPSGTSKVADSLSLVQNQFAGYRGQGLLVARATEPVSPQKDSVLKEKALESAAPWLMHVNSLPQFWSHELMNLV